MKLLHKTLLALSIVLCTNAPAWSQLFGGYVQMGHVDLRLGSAARKYCHIVKFPQGWKYQTKALGSPLTFHYNAEYEFRARGEVSTTFLVGGYESMVGRRYYAKNYYEIDLANPKIPIIPANEVDWAAASPVPLTRQSVFKRGIQNYKDQRAEFNGFQFTKTGGHWVQYHGDTRLSPAQSWIALLSTGPGDKTPMKIFLDLFNAQVGQKLFTMQGTYRTTHGIFEVDQFLGMSGWLTDRFFILSLGEHKETCLVCDFGKSDSQKGKNP